MIEALRSGLSFDAASSLVGVSWRTLLRARQADPDYDAECKRAIAQYEQGLLSTVNEGAQDDANLALKVLERRFPSKWSPIVELRRRNIDEEEAREASDLSDVDDEDLIRIARGEGE